jgi:hypothetical protein
MIRYQFCGGTYRPRACVLELGHAEQKGEAMKFGMVIHGGAGTIERSEMTRKTRERIGPGWNARSELATRC